MNGFSHQLPLFEDRESSPFFPPYTVPNIKIEQDDTWQTGSSLFPLLNISSEIGDYDTFGAAGSAPTYLNLVPAQVNCTAQPTLNDSFGLSYDHRPTLHKMDSELTGNIQDEGIGSSPRSIQSISPPMDPNENGNSNTRDSGAHEGGPSSPIFETGDTPSPSFHVQCAKCGCYVSQDQWWQTTDGHTLCHACHSETLVNVRPRPEPEKKKKKSTVAKATRNLNCSNCGTNVTTLWRRDQQGGSICNPCGLYFKLHNVNRPLTMKKDSIQRRNRAAKGAGKQKNGGSKQKNCASSQRICSSRQNNSSDRHNAGASSLQPYVRPPPPPYQMYATTEINNGYHQFIPQLENIGYCGNYNQEMNFSHFQGGSMH